MDFWGGGLEKTFLDATVFNLFAPSNLGSQMAAVYRRREREVKYEKLNMLFLFLLCCHALVLLVLVQK